MSPQMIQKLPAIHLLEGMFPELTTNQLKVCVFYAMGVPYDAIAQNCRLSPETVRTYLKRSLKNLNLDGYDALRCADANVRFHDWQYCQRKRKNVNK